MSSEKRLRIYRERIVSAEDGLNQDIGIWHQSLPESAIKHHVEQFGIFCKEGLKCLMKVYEKKSGSTSKEKELTFKSLVIGTLTSQWMLLRQVASQHLNESPYCEALQPLDELATRDYYRLRGALPKKVQEHLTPSPPLVYLGRLAELTLFNPQAPAVLSVPFGAAYQDEQSNLAIQHELGHAAFDQLPGFLPELKRIVLDALAHSDLSVSPQLDPQMATVHDVITEWLREMVADMAGTALAGVQFATSALKITVTPDATVGITDKEHPVALIRPYVHLVVLKYLYSKNPNHPNFKQADIVDFEQELSDLVGTRTRRRFESIPALTIVSLATIKREMVKIIEIVLDKKLQALDNFSLGDILLKCSNLDPEHMEVANIEWGKVSDAGCEQIVLKLPHPLHPDHATPAASGLEICCILQLYFCCFGGVG